MSSRKIRSSIRITSLLCLLLVGRITLTSAQVLTLQAPGSVYAGQSFQISFNLDAKSDDDFQPPVWGQDIRIQGPYEQVSTEMSYRNGKLESRERKAWVYICRIAKAGTYTLPSAAVVVDGKKVKSEPKKIEVLAADQTANPNTARNNDPSSSTDDIFVTIQLSQSEVYQGQPVVATLKIYTRVDLVGFDDFRFPDFKGFWAKEVDTPNQIQFTEDVYNGKQYHSGVLRQYVLYPQKSGELKIDPLHADIRYRARGATTSFFDEFMGTYRTATRSLQSAARTLKVLPLPANAPASFKGAVGKFSVDAKVDNTSIKTNEALTYTLTVTGAGNMQLLQKPELNLPSTVEVFPPKMSENYALRGGIQTGSVAYEYVLLPRAPGKLTIPAFEFSYFDPQAKSYKTATTQPYTVDVIADSTQRATTVAGSVSKEDVQYLGKDIRHIYLGNVLLHPLQERFVGTGFWWLLLLLLLALLPILWIVLQRRQSYLADLSLVRGRRAANRARKRLQSAKKHVNSDAQQFYIELERAVWGYIADKLTLELADLSSEALVTSLQEKGVPEDTIEKIRTVIVECEYARYAPSAAANRQEELYTATLEAFEQLERWLKNA